MGQPTIVGSTHHSLWRWSDFTFKVVKHANHGCERAEGHEPPARDSHYPLGYEQLVLQHLNEGSVQG